MKFLLMPAAFVLLMACSSPDAPAEDARSDQTSEEQQRETVEAEIRRIYEAEGAEVVDIAMERTPDDAGFEGEATVRDAETGNEITVDCSVEADRNGAPQISCDRRTQ